jgi:hypothetical protein
MDGTDRHSRSSASASAHACAGVTAAALSSVPGSNDIMTTGKSLSSSALTGAGASPGANLSSSDKAVHSRTGSPRRADRNRFGAGGIAVVGTAARKQSHDPESREQPAQLSYLLALTGMEVEAVKEGFSLDARVSPHGDVLDEVGQLRGPVTAPGGLEVHQVHVVPVPQVVGEVRVALGEHRRPGD